MFVSRALNRWRPGSTDWIGYPRDYRFDASTPGVIFASGGGGAGATKAGDPTNYAGQVFVSRQLARRFPTVTVNYEGLQFGSPTIRNSLLSIKTWMETALNTTPGPCFGIGVSLGNLNLLTTEKHHPGFAYSVVGITPATVIQNIYDEDRGGFRSDIELAYGITFPAPLPAGAELLDGIEASTLPELPYRAYYADDDVLTLPSELEQVVAGMNNAETFSVGNLGHSEAACMAVPMDDVIDFFLASV